MNAATKIAGGCLALLVLLLTSSFAVAEGSEDARHYYDWGVKLQDRGDLVKAVEAFETAVSLRPRSHRYSEALLQAKQQAVVALLQQVDKTDDPQEQARALNLALKFAPADPRPRLLLVDLDAKVATSENMIQSALEKHRAGEIADCRHLTDSLRKWKPMLNNYD